MNEPEVPGQTFMMQAGDFGILYKIIPGYASEENKAKQFKIYFKIEFQKKQTGQRNHCQGHVHTAVDVEIKKAFKKFHTTKIRNRKTPNFPV